MINNPRIYQDVFGSIQGGLLQVAGISERHNAVYGAGDFHKQMVQACAHGTQVAGCAGSSAACVSRCTGLCQPSRNTKRPPLSHSLRLPSSRRPAGQRPASHPNRMQAPARPAVARTAWMNRHVYHQYRFSAQTWYDYRFQASVLPVPTNSETRPIILKISCIVSHSNFMSHQ